MVKFKTKKMKLTTRERIIKKELDVCREQLIREKLSLECICAFEDKMKNTLSEESVSFEEMYPNLIQTKDSLTDEIKLLEFKLNFLKGKRDSEIKKREDQFKKDVMMLQDSENFPDKVSIHQMKEMKKDNN